MLTTLHCNLAGEITKFNVVSTSGSSAVHMTPVCRVVYRPLLVVVFKCPQLQLGFMILDYSKYTTKTNFFLKIQRKKVGEIVEYAHHKFLEFKKTENIWYLCLTAARRHISDKHFFSIIWKIHIFNLHLQHAHLWHHGHL